MPDGPRYDDDFFAWTQHQAAVLREMPVADNRFDRENVAEEIESLGRSERDTVRSHVRRIIEHLLKLAYSNAQPPRFGWIGTIIDARDELENKLSPTLHKDADERLGRIYAATRRRAAVGLREYGETAAADLLPERCPYTLDQILEDDWYPDPPEAPK
jgi:hypothetical protein